MKVSLVAFGSILILTVIIFMEIGQTSGAGGNSCLSCSVADAASPSADKPCGEGSSRSTCAPSTGVNETSCETVVHADRLTGAVKSYTRACVPYADANKDKFVKSYTFGEIVRKWYCNTKDCNNVKIESAITRDPQPQKGASSCILCSKTTDDAKNTKCKEGSANSADPSNFCLISGTETGTSCKSVAVTDRATNEITSFSRECVPYNTAKNKKFDKTFTATEITRIWYCDKNNCNNQTFDVAIAEDTFKKSPYCIQCIYDSKGTNPDANCASGNVFPTKCSLSGDVACDMTTYFEVETNIAKIKRGCIPSSGTGSELICDRGTATTDIPPLRKTACYCFSEGCNNAPKTFFETEIQECVNCQFGEKDNIDLCQTVDNRLIPDYCPKGSCLTKLYYKGSVIVSTEKKCSDKKVPVEKCEKLSDANGVHISCHCNGKLCNLDLPKDNLLLPTKSTLFCLQCKHEDGEDNCESGDHAATICPDTSKTCAVMVEAENGKIVAESIDRQCSDSARYDYCDTNSLGGDKMMTTCYCKGDECNNKNVLLTGSGELTCLECEHSEIDPSKANPACTAGVGRSVACPEKSCSYREEKLYDKLQAFKRGCSEKTKLDTFGFPRDCDDDYDYATVKVVRTCYCFTNDCNGNTPDGFQCPQCNYKRNPGCTDGTNIGLYSCRNDRTEKYDRAEIPSCRSINWTDTATGKYLGVTRDCVKFTPNEGCRPPVTENGLTRTECFCKADGCIAIKWPEEHLPTTKSSWGSQNISFLIHLFALILCVIATVQ